MSQKQWIAGINAVSAALEHDAEHVREVLIEASAKNPRLAEIENRAQRLDIAVRKVATQALDGVVGNLRHQGVVARYAAAKTYGENDLQALVTDMMQHDIELFKRDTYLMEAGHKVLNYHE